MSNELNKTNPCIQATSPLGYLDFLCLMSNAAIVLTDSGGLQEETTISGTPSRQNTDDIGFASSIEIIKASKKEKLFIKAYDF